MTLPHRPSVTGATLVHPGPVATPRVLCVPTRLTAYDVALPAGQPLLPALDQLLTRIDSRTAVGELLGGQLTALASYIPGVGTDGGVAADFAGPYTGAAPARLIRGGITIGGRDDAVFAHSHALWADADGVERAGHLIPDSVVLGEGVRARLWACADVRFEVEADPETTMSLFVPRRVADTGRGEVAAVLCRCRPNVDLVAAVEDLAEDQGWDAAEVRGQLGSLVGGVLAQPDGSVVTVDGPATEVLFLDGSVRRRQGRMVAALDAHLLDRHGAVHRGRLLPGATMVAMTYELVLAETSS